MESLVADLEADNTVLTRVAKPRRKGQFVPFAADSRFVIDLLEFHPDGGGYGLAKWKPQHLLSVPSAKLLADAHPREELHFENNEQPLLTRTDALKTVARWNHETCIKLEMREEKKYLWFFVIELGFVATDSPFAAVNHDDCEFDLLRMRFRYVKPTAAELAQFGKGGDA